MSYPYRVVVTKGVEENISASDRSEKTLEVPPILDQEAARGLLEQALERRGWVKREDGKLAKTEDGLEQVFDIETGKVVTTVEDEDTIKKELTLEGHGDSWSRPTAADEEALRRKVEAEVDKRLEISESEREARQEALEERLAKKLSETDAARTEELNEVLLEVYAESLKEKAKGLGNVTEVREERVEETGEYELVIRVEA